MKISWSALKKNDTWNLISGWAKSFVKDRDPMREKVFAVSASLVVIAGVFWGVEFFGILLMLAGTAFIQNMAFTAVSRSRNAGDPEYHRKCAWASNGIWLACQLLIWAHLWAAFSTDSFARLIPLIVVYTMFTTEGSVFMMRELLKKEKGKRQVGAAAAEAQLIRIKELEETVDSLQISVKVLTEEQIKQRVALVKTTSGRGLY